MAFEVGKDIEGMCSTCGDVWHVIVAKVGDKVTKVQCKQCGKLHRLKPTGAAPEANLSPKRRTVASPRVKSSSTSSSKRGGRSRAAAAGVVIDPLQPIRPYAMSERFAVGEQIRHKKFGEGVVCGVEEGKIRVNFSEATKVLLHDRKS